MCGSILERCHWVVQGSLKFKVILSSAVAANITDLVTERFTSYQSQDICVGNLSPPAPKIECHKCRAGWVECTEICLLLPGIEGVYQHARLHFTGVFIFY